MSALTGPPRRCKIHCLHTHNYTRVRQTVSGLGMSPASLARSLSAFICRILSSFLPLFWRRACVPGACLHPLSVPAAPRAHCLCRWWSAEGIVSCWRWACSTHFLTHIHTKAVLLPWRVMHRFFSVSLFLFLVPAMFIYKALIVFFYLHRSCIMVAMWTTCKANQTGVLVCFINMFQTKWIKNKAIMKSHPRLY